MTPTEVVTGAAPVYPAVIEEPIPSAWHHVAQYANNPIEVRHDAARDKRTRRREGRQMMSVA